MPLQSTTIARLFLLALTLLGFGPVLHAGGIVSGQVIDSNSGLGVGRVQVSLQASETSTVTAPDGSFSLNLASGSGLVLVAAKKGYYHGSATVSSPSSGVTIQLDQVVVGDNQLYSLVDPGVCGSCHPDQWNQWTGSPMSKAGTNTWLYDIFNGTGTPGGMGGFVYTRDSVHATASPNSECASCHQPEPWIYRFGRPLEPIGSLSQGSMHGVSCEVCHKMADIDETKVNFPGIWPGFVEFNRPDDPLFQHQVQYGVLGDVDYVAPFMMQPSYQPQLVAEACAACHQDKNDPDGDHDFEEANGIISEPTFLEWLASPYGDPQGPKYASCVECHMPPYGATEVAQVSGYTVPQRDPETIRGHRIEGTTPYYLENAVDLRVDFTRDATGIDVEVTIDNDSTGHHVPTGVTVRNMILLVEAVRTSDSGALLPLGSQVVHQLGGVGNPAQGYYAGLPGKFFAKVNHDANGNGPTFFTDATGISFDNRIPALTSDISNYRFAAPAGTGEIKVRARLIYRRAFRFLVDAKQWTTDGHGNPLEDVQSPHFGHLMEEVVLHAQGAGPGSNYCDSSPNSTGAPAAMSATGSSSIAAGDLTLMASNVPDSTFGLFYFGSTTVSLPMGNGLRCVGGVLGRFPVIGPTSGPVQSQAVNPPSLPGNTTVLSGDTLHFQFWFRDAASSAEAVDFSDGYTVTFVP